MPQKTLSDPTKVSTPSLESHSFQSTPIPNPSKGNALLLADVTPPAGQIGLPPFNVQSYVAVGVGLVNHSIVSSLEALFVAPSLVVPYYEKLSLQRGTHWDTRKRLTLPSSPRQFNGRAYQKMSDGGRVRGSFSRPNGRIALRTCTGHGVFFNDGDPVTMARPQPFRPAGVRALRRTPLTPLKASALRSAHCDVHHHNHRPL